MSRPVSGKKCGTRWRIDEQKKDRCELDFHKCNLLFHINIRKACPEFYEFIQEKETKAPIIRNVKPGALIPGTGVIYMGIYQGMGRETS
jgi:hypothetical protein